MPSREHDMFSLMSIVPGAWMTSSSNINLQSYNTIKKTIEKQLTDLTSQNNIVMNGSLLSSSSRISADKLIDAHVRPVIIRKLEALKEQLEEERTQLTSNDAPNETQIAAAEELARTRVRVYIYDLYCSFDTNAVVNCLAGKHTKKA